LRAFRVIAATAVAVAVTALSASSALAQGATTSTDVTKHLTDTFESANPCTGDFGDETLDLQIVLHQTTTPSGNVTGHMNASGSFGFRPYDPALPTYEGHINVNQELNSTQNGLEGTNVNHITARGSDGSVLRFRVVQHTTFANGEPKVSFTQFSCGDPVRF
jgi:hypothetical protein